MTRTATGALFAALMTAMTGAALAQTIPPGQTCGGLFCDLGIFGHKVPVGPDGAPPSPAAVAAVEAADPHRLPCHDFLCRAFGQREAAEAPPAAEPVPAAEAEKPVRQIRKVKRKHVANTESPTAAESAAPK